LQTRINLNLLVKNNNMKNRDFINQADIDYCLLLINKKKGIKIHFENGKIIQDCIFQNLDLNNLSFENTILKNCRFINLNLLNINFKNAVLWTVEFINCEGTDEMENQINVDHFNSFYKISSIRRRRIAISKEPKSSVENEEINPGNRRKPQKQTVYDRIKKTVPQSKIDEINRQR
jgi:hypothetical protein